jgi:GTPase SAR1 family protein
MGNTKPIRRQKQAGLNTTDKHVFLFGLESAGKTHMLYRRLAKNSFDLVLA